VAALPRQISDTLYWRSGFSDQFIANLSRRRVMLMANWTWSLRSRDGGMNGLEFARATTASGFR